jgi:hypothetical protein
MPSLNIDVEFMPLLNIDVEFEVFCSCGNGLCNQTTVEYKHGGQRVIIEPCDKCLQNAMDEGYAEGESDGYGDGFKEGEEKCTVTTGE